MIAEWRVAAPFLFSLVSLAIPAAHILVGTCMMVYGIVWQPLASLTALATVGAGALVYRYGVRARGV
jgi:hypothetical protein